MKYIMTFFLSLLLAVASLAQGFIFSGGSTGGVTWSVSQHPHNFTCVYISGTTETCAVTTSATTAGHGLLLLWSDFVTGPTSFGATYNAASGDGSWTHCPASLAAAGSSGFWTDSDCAYIASATGGATTITLTLNIPMGTTGSHANAEILEIVRSTGTAAYDTGNASIYNSGCTTNCNGPAITLTGTDFVATWTALNSAVTAPGSPYTNPIDTDGSNVFSGFGGALTQASYTTPVWQQASLNIASVSAVAFK